MNIFRTITAIGMSAASMMAVLIPSAMASDLAVLPITVPEPGTLGILAVGIIGAIIVTRLRK